MPVNKGAVAPRAGAWIETYLRIVCDCRSPSRPARARGLKLDPLGIERRDSVSRPARARGLKPFSRKSARRLKGRAPRGRVD